MGTRHADGVTMGHTRKRGERDTGGCVGRRERRPESPLRDGRRSGDVGPTWGMARAESKKRRLAGLGGRRTFGGREASGVDPDTHGVGGEEGGREASGVEEISTLELVLCCWKIL